MLFLHNDGGHRKMRKIKYPSVTALIFASFFVFCMAFNAFKSMSATIPRKAPLPISEWGKEENGCVMAIYVREKEFEPCAPVIIRIYVKNVGKGNLRLVDRGSPCDFMFEIKNSKGEVIPYTRYGKAAVDKIGKYNKGSKYIINSGEEEFFWSERIQNMFYDITKSDTYSIKCKTKIVKRDAEGNSVQYEVRGKNENEVAMAYEQIEVTSNTIEIKVE